jgi:hypothetical protein
LFYSITIYNNIKAWDIQKETYWSSVVTMPCPLEPQSLDGPLTLAQATYHLLAYRIYRNRKSQEEITGIREPFPRDKAARTRRWILTTMYYQY